MDYVITYGLAAVIGFIVGQFIKTNQIMNRLIIAAHNQEYLGMTTITGKKINIYPVPEHVYEPMYESLIKRMKEGEQFDGIHLKHTNPNN